ncbi:tetratricopeptide repeat protein [Adhaeribacter aquaticus]|uniref:tetratricopeptide repeat protein n=1 Tax=Adhaeribacter aquaticus TaxID=299567 RepID=UPI00041CB7B5|nr:hypothetical protein [Adhaeribacter aquaticus]
MAKAHPFFLFLFFLSFIQVPTLQAETEFNPQVAAAYSEIFKLKIDSGRRIIQQQLAQNPTNLAAILVANYPDFLQLIITQDANKYITSIKAQEKRFEQIKKSEEKTPYKMFAQAEIKIQIALCQFFFDDELKAAWNIRQAFLLLQENQRLYPNFYPNQKSLGLLHFVIGSIPESYNWLLSLLGMNANVKTGINFITKAAETNQPFQQEAKLLYHFINDMLHQNDDQSVIFFQQLATQHPDNLLFSFVALGVLQKNKKCDEALTLFQKRPAGKEYLAIDYMHHMAADMYLFKGNYFQSIQENQYFIKNYQGKHYLKDSHYKMYLAATLLNDSHASRYVASILKVGTDFVEEDQIALKYAKNPDNINLTLLKARLHADGGYYKEAESVLKNFDASRATNNKDKIEYFYRLGRTFQGLKKYPEAKENFLKTITLTGNLPFYFAPNAALQLGYMAMENKNINEARYYFKKTLSYKEHPYKRSLDSKAKVALAAL